jgi:MYXO-CTERM domain-containing protein
VLSIAGATAGGLVLAALTLGVLARRRRRRVTTSEPIKLPGVKFHL